MTTKASFNSLLYILTVQKKNKHFYSLPVWGIWTAWRMMGGGPGYDMQKWKNLGAYSPWKFYKGKLKIERRKVWWIV